MIKPDGRTLEAIMGLRGTGHWRAVVEWMERSFHVEQQQLLIATEHGDMYRRQGRAGQLKEILDRISPDARGVPGGG